MLPQYARVHGALHVFAAGALLNVALGSLLLVLGELAIGSMCIATGTAFVLASRKSTARRYLVSDWFRVPRYPRASAWLVYRRQRLVLINVICSVLITVIVFTSLEGWLEWAALLVFAAVTAPVLIAAVKMHIKFALDTHFRIVFFRRYDETTSLHHKSRLLPICGFFGQVLWFEDDRLTMIWEGGRLRLEQWVFGELYQPLVAERGSEGWRELVREQLCYADFAIFDWPTEITGNMEWEFAQASELLPCDRIMIVVSPDSFDAARMTVERLTGSKSSEFNFVGGAHSGMGEALFIYRFLEAMAGLRPSKRPAAHVAGAVITPG